MELFTDTRKLRNLFFWQLEISMCAPRVTRHTSIRYSSSCHTRVNMGASIFLYTNSHCLAAEIWTTMKNNFLGKQFLSCSFYLYRFRKYLYYGFPIINCCTPGVHYETSCICVSSALNWIHVTLLTPAFKTAARSMENLWAQAYALYWVTPAPNCTNQQLATHWTVRLSNPGGVKRISAPVQTGPGADQTSSTMGAGKAAGARL
jgi:hypothetical protein